MNKILNINLGGYAITIDDDAYEYLNAYLDSLRKRFSESEGRDEIVHDIESRLGELISQNMGTRSIVMLPDVEAAIEIMGKPEDFDEGPAAESSSSTGSRAKTGRGAKAQGGGVRTGKRLFRDEEDATVGGVCSGLSAYFGMHDPVWMRLIFVLLTFLSAGFWMPAYLLLWILVPPAKTAADRLAMRGEPINVDNIAKEIEDSFERLSTKVNDLGAEKKSASSDRSFGSTMSHGVSALGQMFGFVVRFIAKFALVIAAIVAIGLFIALAVSWVAGIWGLLVAAPFVDYFSPYSSGATWLGFANLFFLFGIPILGLCLMFARALFKVRTPGWLNAGLGLFWVVNLISVGVLAGFAAKSYRSSGTVTKTIDLSGIGSDTLRVVGINAPSSNGDNYLWFDEGDGVRFGDNRMEISNLVEIRVRRSDSGNFQCVQNITARGTSRSEALSNAEQTDFAISGSGNVLRVPTSYSIARGQKWRGQHIRLNIDLPVGKYIVFDDKIYRRAAADMDEYADGNDRNYISRSPDRVFRMTGKGLLCTSCPQFGDREYRSDEYYENFIFEGDFEIEMSRANDFSISIEGPADAIEKIRTDKKLILSKKGNAAGVKVVIKTPVLTSLIADQTGNITIRGFEEGDASISVKGDNRLKAYIDVSDQFDVSLSGKCSLELVGKGGQLDVNLNDGATLEAASWQANDVEITASNNSKARVFAKDDALVISDGGSTVTVEGGAKVRNTRYENN